MTRHKMFKCNRTVYRWNKTFLLCYLFLLVVCDISDVQSHISTEDIIKQKRQLQRVNTKSLLGNPSSCTRTKRTADHHHPLHHHPRDLSMGRGRDTLRGGSALYFTGGELIRSKMTRKTLALDLSRGNFTVELWINPEGGQFDPVTVLGKSLLMSHVVLLYV